MKTSAEQLCQLCGRAGLELTRHHLIPKARHNKRAKSKVEIEELRNLTIDICLSCHCQIHAVLNNKQLEREFNTLEKLRAHPEMAKFIAWISNKEDNTRVAVRKSRSRAV